MRTSDIFVTTAAKLNESIEKVFGKKLNLESFDLPQLEDARNKLRTQVSQVRSESGFNENLENDAYTQAQWMLDAINAEIAERQEFIADPHQATLEYDSYEDDTGNDVDYSEDDDGNPTWTYNGHTLNLYGDHTQGEVFIDKKFVGQYETSDSGTRKFYNASGEPMFVSSVDDDSKIAEFLKSKFSESMDIEEKAPPTAKGERMVKHIKKGYAKDGKLTDKEKSIAYATAWKQHNKEKNESINTGEDMRNLREGEIQQASAIVTAKTMVDRVGRWIEELSGMENDTLLQLGDSIRDEMGQEQAKSFISAVAPAIQQALENLKTTRETLASGVRTLTGEEQGAEMLGGEPAPGEEGGEAGGIDDLAGPAEPDAMNPDAEIGAEDEFATAEPAVGGAEEAGRAKRESIDYSNSLLKVLAG